MIGKVIREQRNLRGITQKELAEGICSEKYIYLIERNERNPSVYIVNQLSERLSIDLFEYYQYLEFENTTLVVEYKKKFDKYVQLADIEQLKKKSLKAAQLKDFKQEPLSYDLMMISLLYKGLVQGKTNKAINKLTSIFEKKNLNIHPRTLINGYVVLATCYQLEGKIDKAKDLLENTYEMLKNKREFTRYHTVIITTMISLASCLYNVEDYDKLQKHSKELLKFQEENNQYSRIYYSHFYLSFTYYKNGQLIKSEDHFMKGLHSALLFENKMDISIIVKMKHFNEVVDKLNINQYYIKKIYKALN